MKIIDFDPNFDEKTKGYPLKNHQKLLIFGLNFVKMIDFDPNFDEKTKGCPIKNHQKLLIFG